MKTKLISMQWKGCASVDPRFSATMLPWTVADIYSREQYSSVSFQITYFANTYLYSESLNALLTTTIFFYKFLLL